MIVPQPVRSKLEELETLVEKYPDYIPIPVLASFLGANAEGLRNSIEKGNAPFGICWQKEVRHGKLTRPGNRAYKVPTATFWLWYTNNAATK